MLGVMPRSSTGQSRVRCWPGGSRWSSGRAIVPVRNLPSRAQRCLLAVSFESGGRSSSVIAGPPLFAFGPSLVTVHRRGVLGVAHGGVDNQRQEDHAAEIIIEPLLVALLLEVQRDRRRG